MNVKMSFNGFRSKNRKSGDTWEQATKQQTANSKPKNLTAGTGTYNTILC